MGFIMNGQLVDRVADFDSIAVRQANALAKSGQELDLTEKRLLLVAMSRIANNDTELLTHRISVTDLAPYFKGDPWRAANKAAQGLLKRVVYIKGNDGGYTAFPWTTLARYVPASQSDSGSSYLEIRLNQELAPFLLELKKNFNVIPLLELLPMGSVNSQRLYEVLWHDSHRGNKLFLTYDLAELRFQLGLRTSKKVKGKDTWVEKYASWRDFQKVLKRAQADFVNYGSLRFDYDGLVQGRTTTQVRFRIVPKETLAAVSPSDPEVLVKQQELADRLHAAGYNQDALAAVQTHGCEEVEVALKLVQTAVRTGAKSSKPIHNPGGMIYHTLKNGLAKRRLERSERSSDDKPDPKALAQSIIDAYAAARQSIAESIWASLTLEAQNGFSDLMRLYLSDFEVRQLNKFGWDGASFESSKRRVVLELYPDDIPDELLSLRAFAEQEDRLHDFDEALRAAVLNECDALSS